MSIWSIITGAKKVGAVVDTGLDLVKSASSGIDMMFYTDEEKAQAKAKVLPVLMDHVVKMNEAAKGESSIRSITRRIIALNVLGLFDLFVLAGFGCLFLGKGPTINDLTSLAQAYMLPQITLTVIVFYFGYYGLEKFKK